MRFPAYSKYKSSGVEWLGDIPQKWEVKRVKYIGRIRYGLGEPPEYVDQGLPLIRATDGIGRVSELARNGVQQRPESG